MQTKRLFIRMSGISAKKKTAVRVGLSVLLKGTRETILSNSWINPSVTWLTAQNFSNTLGDHFYIKRIETGILRDF